jgi:hypothetical protein
MAAAVPFDNECLGIRSSLAISNRDGRYEFQIVPNLEEFTNLINQHHEHPLVVRLRMANPLVVAFCGEELKSRYNNDDRVHFVDQNGRIYNRSIEEVNVEILQKLEEESSSYAG